MKKTLIQNKALILIDIQNDYFTAGKMPVIDAEIVSINAKSLLTYFRKENMAVVHIQHVSIRDGSFFFIPNTAGVEIHSNVKPMENEKIVVKHYPNGFFETELLKFLTHKEITDVVICGMMTNMCVDATVRAAKDFGFNIELISDACTTKDLEINGKSVKAQEVQKSFLASLNYYYSEVLSTKDFLCKQK